MGCIVWRDWLDGVSNLCQLLGHHVRGVTEAIWWGRGAGYLDLRRHHNDPLLNNNGCGGGIRSGSCGQGSTLAPHRGGAFQHRIPRGCPDWVTGAATAHCRKGISSPLLADGNLILGRSGTKAGSWRRITADPRHRSGRLRYRLQAIINPLVSGSITGGITSAWERHEPSALEQMPIRVGQQFLMPDPGRLFSPRFGIKGRLTPVLHDWKLNQTTHTNKALYSQVLSC